MKKQLVVLVFIALGGSLSLLNCSAQKQATQKTNNPNMNVASELRKLSDAEKYKLDSRLLTSLEGRQPAMPIPAVTENGNTLYDIIIYMYSPDDTAKLIKAGIVYQSVVNNWVTARLSVKDIIKAAQMQTVTKITGAKTVRTN